MVLYGAQMNPGVRANGVAASVNTFWRTMASGYTGRRPGEWAIKYPVFNWLRDRARSG